MNNNGDDTLKTEPSSRLIVKNLPNKINAEQLKESCGKLGEVTDCQLKFTSSGKFRNFGFVGFRTVAEAEAAKKFLNNTFIGSSKIQVEFCQRLNEFGSKKKKNGDETSRDNQNLNKTTVDSDVVRVLIENLPLNIKKKTIKNFIMPVKPARIDVFVDKRAAEIKVLKKSDAKILQKLDGRFFGGDKISVKLKEEPSLNVGVDLKKLPMEFKDLKAQSEAIHETGRLFVRNIPYVCTLADVQETFEKFGPISDVKMPLDAASKNHKGYAIISFLLPENALKAFSEMDGTVYNGRMLHIVPGEDSKEKKPSTIETQDQQSYKAVKAQKLSKSASQGHNWNTFFLGQNAIADVLVDKLDTEKNQLLDAKSKSSLGVRMALGETQLVRETREYLTKNGISLDSFAGMNRSSKRSSTIILVKNLPAKTTDDELRVLFSKYGEICRLILPPFGISAVLEFFHEQHAKKAFSALAYKKFKSTPLYLEWAPNDVFNSNFVPNDPASSNVVDEEKRKEPDKSDSSGQDTLAQEEVKPEDQTTLFVKNLSFNTTDQQLYDHFSRIGPLKYATVAKKKAKDGGLLSMGYGFVQFMRKSDASNALKVLQRQKLDDFALELKLSDRLEAEVGGAKGKRKAEDDDNQPKKGTGAASETKILVKNVPFQADKKELDALFKTFGELKSVRLPRKAGGGGDSKSHRGFAFVDFVNKSDAQKAFEALRHSTHLYGRRLVLGWAAEDQDLDDLRAKIADFGSSKSTNKRHKIMLESAGE